MIKLRKGECKGNFKKGYYEFRYRYKDSNKRSHDVYAHTLKELRDKEEKINKALSDNLVIGTYRLYTYGLQLIKDATDIEQSTKAAYMCQINKLKKEYRCLADKDIKDVSYDDIDKYILFLQKKGYSCETIKNKLHAISTIFSRAQVRKIVSFNPCALHKIKESEKDRIKRQTEADIDYDDAAFNELIRRLRASNIKEKYAHELVIQISKGIGTRAGETAGLQINNVDISNGIIYIKDQVRYGYNVENNTHGYSRKSTKTRAGERMTITDFIAPGFLESAIELHNKRLPLAKTQDIANCLFINRQGGYLSMDSIRRTLTSLSSDEANAKAIAEGYPAIPHFHPHIFRDMFVATLLDNDVAKEDIIRLVGHTDISTTLKHYDKRSNKKVADRIKDKLAQNNAKQPNGNVIPIRSKSYKKAK